MANKQWEKHQTHTEPKHCSQTPPSSAYVALHTCSTAAAAAAKYPLKSNCEQAFTGSLHQSHGKSDTETQSCC